MRRKGKKKERLSWAPGSSAKFSEEGIIKWRSEK